MPEVLRLVVVDPIFTDAFFDKLFRANLVALAQMRLVEHAIVQDVVANH
jgi:hypothetical protein